MITMAEMMDRLLAVCPSFQPTWLEFLEYWQDEADDLPYYGALADFARHLIKMLEQSEIADFPAIFQTIEQLQSEGGPEVREAMIVGLLEGLQNLNLHSATKPEQFSPFLGPESRKSWAALYEFWENINISKQAHLIEASPQITPDSIQDPELRRIVQEIYRQG